MAEEYFQHDQALVSPEALIGRGTRIWAFANVQAGAIIGEGCNICDGCFVERGARIGNQVTLKNQVAVWDGVTLEDDVFVGAGAAFINDRNPRSNRRDPWTLERVLVKKGATIGANATVMCGVTIGEYAVAGAGSVVVRDIPAYAVAVGNPARVIGHACACGKPLTGLTCACGLVYAQSADGVRPA